MKVRLTYFKPNGKFYSSGEYTSAYPAGRPLYVFWDEVEELARTRSLPGLVQGHDDYIILVDVPQHANRHPCLILPEAAKAA